MYVKLREIIFFFEYMTKPKIYYFNIADYKIYNQNEWQEAINSDLYEKSDFLPIPQKDQDEIIIEYLLQKGNHRLIRAQKDDDFRHKFHWYTEGDDLVQEWKRFEKEALIKFATAWCEENNIIFTLG